MSAGEVIVAVPVAARETCLEFRAIADDIILLAPQVMATHLANFTRSFPKVRMVTRTGTIEDVIALVREHVVSLALVWVDDERAAGHAARVPHAGKALPTDAGGWRPALRAQVGRLSLLGLP